jgi:hypothetical protein
VTRFGDVESTAPIAAMFSPNGHWVAYGAVESGSSAIWIQQFPSGAKYQVARGNHPVWSPDGKELLFNVAPSQLAVVELTTQPTVGFRAPQSIPRPWVMFGGAYPREYDIAPDGRFLGVVPRSQRDAGNTDAQINVVLNWFEELKQRVPTK